MVMLELHHKHSETPETPREFVTIINPSIFSANDNFIVVWAGSKAPTTQRYSVEEWNPRLVFQEG